MPLSRPIRMPRSLTLAAPAWRWTLAVAGAAGAYAGLHALAGDPGASDVARAPAPPLASTVHALAAIGQFVVPALTVAAAALWPWRQRRSAATTAGGAVDALDWPAFRARVAEAFVRRGYQLAEPGVAGTPVYLTLRKSRETFLVQCKHWQDVKVGVDAIRDLHALMHARGAHGGFALTRGRFGRDAHALAVQCAVRLLEGEALEAMLREVRASPAR